MKIANAAVDAAEIVHALQIRYLLSDPEVAKVAKIEDLAAVRHSIPRRTCLIAEHRGVALGAIRAQDRGGFVYIDALWVPDFVRRLPLCALLLLELETRFAPKRTYQLRAIHGDARCHNAYVRAAYAPVYEERRADGLLLRLYEKIAL
ncbi:hypothetical protein [Paenibacillus cymbidii]|uniref:hypothetical protein n=1 Tax=Paenibacillus cymbidii TaxID=1639034 RepID=UPI0010815039|nr:hypothetical protein [Paenibacillus cymbidii]